jgi:hypothetical protein
MYIKKSLPIICYISWGGLGFIRGINSYKYEKKENYLYVNSVCYGIYGIGLYISPFLLPFSLHKEIYRLEVNLRNLENEKKTKYYNNLW